MLRSVPSPAACECEARHVGGSPVFCSCKCHGGEVLTEASLAAGVRAMSERDGYTVPERAKAVRRVSDD